MNNPTPATAAERIADLEKAAFAGESVDPAELSAARELARIEQIAAEGRAERAAAEAARKALELREQTKRDVAANVAASPHADLMEEFDNAVNALEALISAVDGRNELLVDIYRRYSRGGVPMRGWDGAIPEGWDGANSARIEQGEQVVHVIVAGKTYRYETPALWVRAAVLQVAEAHGGLPLPYSSPFVAQLAGDIPDVIRERQQAKRALGV